MTLKKRPASFAWYALGERIFIYLEHEDSVDTISLIMAQKATLGRLTKSFILMKKKNLISASYKDSKKINLLLIFLGRFSRGSVIKNLNSYFLHIIRCSSLVVGRCGFMRFPFT